MAEKKPVKDYTRGVPTEPPEGMIEWLKSKKELSKEYLIYKATWIYDPIERRKREMAECVCTACGDRYYLEKVSGSACARYSTAPFGILNFSPKEAVTGGNTTVCPECGAAVTARHVGNIRYGFSAERVHAASVHVVNGIPYVLSWVVEKYICKDGRVRITSHMYEGYAFDGRKAVKIQGYYKHFTTLSWLCEWEQKGRCTDTLGAVEYIYPFDAHLLDGTCLENAKLDMFVAEVSRPAPVTYLRLYQKHRNAENLVVQGAARLLQEMMDKQKNTYYGYTQYKVEEYGINWKAKRPCDMLGMNKSEFALCARNKWTLKEYEIYMLMKKNGVLISAAEVRLLAEHGRYNLERLINFERPRGVGVMRCIRYLEKQQKNARNVTPLLDYWNMKRQLGEEPVTDAEIFPQNLTNAHDICTRRQREQRDAKVSEKVTKRAAELSRYCFAFEGLAIQPPQDATDLYNEGKALNHCVYSYLNRHANGDTAILFVRHVSEPQKPFFTLELDEKHLTVRQNRGKNNCARTEEVVRFEKKFLEFLHKSKKARANA